MLYKVPLCLLICLPFHLLGYGSGKDTLTASERVALEKGLERFSSNYYFLADSFSRKKDSLKASFYFLKIDPYYLMWSFGDPPSPDTIMSRLYLTFEARRKYKELYKEAYESKSELYARFESMRKKDQRERWLLERCDDDLTCRSLRRRLKQGDSVRFDFLYRYVQTNGWPTVANGSLYAALIAIHDHEHHEFYIPHLKKAIQNSQASIQPLSLILHWQSQKMTRAGYQKMLDTARKVSFDVSSLLNNELPASLPRIIEAVKENCPVRPFLMFEAHDVSVYEEYVTSTNYPYRRSHIIGKLFKELQPQCPKAIAEDVHALRYLPALRSKRKIMLYLILDPKHIQMYEDK